ncbi:MAG: hypothetical protein COW73_10765 [Nitrospirae bacterium CG18_big_fil_WC_8_21_14_2_50_70_55]|nr:TMEM165/GDT1 family protein [Deltaproteobacteria bacterium]OIP62797.1 MAG: UPF0016 family membrane protein [Nitrospirae bacterium CG2_30_70_394]PIQ03462.1 MAG: hypothetical protein COW73_10765 [Nitrospirae bacterium CG18_big_fil_WC_8_21_14_2_50_70_55]PIU79951.1 MAG: hypothetical protein COS73_01835 [Nitrospirae bacterium CG06_land_8_20_14_3_00_70_43]PIW82283.1 MAG: hypothetical protein COZ96_09405 [Nitrospirae bacterium CG_4_8_14_3_um_filter_70_85]PIX82940.1 MAG: hypothetical protein COZ33_
MDLKLLATVFATVFLAEIADKTQVATLLYASQPGNGRFTVFLGAALALVASCTIAVFAGQLLGRWLDPKLVSSIAGVAFIAVGVWVLVSG